MRVREKVLGQRGGPCRPLKAFGWALSDMGRNTGNCPLQESSALGSGEKDGGARCLTGAVVTGAGLPGGEFKRAVN